MAQQANLPSSTQDTLEAILLDLDSLLFAKENYNFQPIVSVPITQDNGIEILGRFIFQDIVDGEVGPTCYVTVRRNMETPFVHNGLGFAFFAADSLSGVYNIYLVDNDALIQDVYMYNNMVIQNEGINNFLAAGRRPLVNNTWYKFRLLINEYYGMKLWIVDDNIDTTYFGAGGLSNNTYYNPATLTLTSGGYVAEMGAQYGIAYSGYQYAPMCSGNSFGIGVLNTRGGIWQFDSIQINSVVPTYPFTYYKMSIPRADFPTTKATELKWYGYGEWGDTTSSGVQLWILKYPDSAMQWEKVGESYWKPPSTLPGNSITRSLIYKRFDDISLYRDIWGYAHLYATTTNAHAISKLHTNYIGFNTEYPSGIHQGGMIDAYVKNSSKVSRITSSTISYDPTAGGQLIGRENTIGPILAVRGVYNGGTPLVLGVDYEIVNTNPDYTYSVYNAYKIVAPSFAGDLTIDYLYYQDGETLQTYVSSDSVRNPASSVLIKSVAPVIVSVENLEYTGGPDAATMRTRVKEYVQGLDREFDISKLVIYMQSVGAVAFNLDTISVQISEYGSLNELLYGDYITNRYILTSSGLNMFVTDEVELAGIVRV